MLSHARAEVRSWGTREPQESRRARAKPAGSRFNELVDSVGSQTQCQLAPPFFLQEETSYPATLSSLSAPRKTMLVLAALGRLTHQVASCPRGAEPVPAFGVRVFRLADCVQVGTITASSRSMSTSRFWLIGM